MHLLWDPKMVAVCRYAFGVFFFINLYMYYYYYYQQQQQQNIFHSLNRKSNYYYYYYYKASPCCLISTTHIYDYILSFILVSPLAHIDRTIFLYLAIQLISLLHKAYQGLKSNPNEQSIAHQWINCLTQCYNQGFVYIDAKEGSTLTQKDHWIQLDFTCFDSRSYRFLFPTRKVAMRWGNSKMAYF
jgi:hypothetical protein